VTTAIKLFRALIPFLKQLKAPFPLLVKLYVTIIVPAMIYGLNCSSTTKANEVTLMRREIFVIKELSKIAHPKPSQSSIAEILNYKTINRKISVGHLRYFYHVNRSSTGSLILKSLNYNENARRKIGRPIFTFHDSLKKDFKKLLQVGVTKSELDRDFELRDSIKRLTSLLFSDKSLQDDPLSLDVQLYFNHENVPENPNQM
jgi:hypothetical protein